MSDGRDGFRVVGCDASQPGGYFHRKGYRIVVPSSPGLMSLTPELTFIFADEDAPQLRSGICSLWLAVRCCGVQG
jgi:hypothetical protein